MTPAKIKPKIWNPPTAPRPVAKYSQCALCPDGLTYLEITGQIGMDTNGFLPEGIEAQTHIAWANIIAILRANDMDYEDIISLRIYLTSRDDLEGYRKARQDFFVDPPRPSTLIFAAGLFDPKWKIEIEARAAKDLG